MSRLQGGHLGWRCSAQVDGDIDGEICEQPLAASRQSSPDCDEELARTLNLPLSVA